MSKLLNSIAPGLVSSGVSTIGNLIGSGITAGQSYKYQQKLAEQQFGYNKQLLQMQMDYNNPKTQLDYYKKAGINPYAAIGNNTSVSLPSVGQGNVSVPDLSQLGSSAVNSYVQGTLLGSQKDLQVAQAQQAINQAQVYEQTKLKLAAETKNQNIQNDILSRTANDHVKLARAEVAMRWAQVGQNESQSALNELQAISMELTNRALPTQLSQSIAEQAGNIKLQYLQGSLTLAQTKAALAAAFKSSQEAYGVHLDNSITSRIADSYVDNYIKTNAKLQKEIEILTKQEKWYELEKLLGAVASGVGSAVGIGKLRSLSRVAE